MTVLRVEIDHPVQVQIKCPYCDETNIPECLTPHNVDNLEYCYRCGGAYVARWKVIASCTPLRVDGEKTRTAAEAQQLSAMAVGGRKG